jgi:hypothetical protein
MLQMMAIFGRKKSYKLLATTLAVISLVSTRYFETCSLLLERREVQAVGRFKLVSLLLMSSSSYPFTHLGQGGPFQSQLSYRLGVS